MPLQTPSPTLLNARYVAIRTAEARNMTDRLLQAARDRTPGVRRLLAGRWSYLPLTSKRPQTPHRAAGSA
jgi:hypothetical protein